MKILLRLNRIIKNSFDNSSIYYIVMLATFIVATMLGAFFLKILSDDISLRLVNLFSPSINTNLGILETFKKSFLLNCLFLLAVFLSGAFNLGFFSILLVFIRGNLLGISVGYLIKNFGIKGFFTAIICIYPQYIIYLPCIVISGALSILFDRRTNLINRMKNRIIRLDLSDYIIFFILLLVAMTTGSIYEGFISPIFFKFYI